jgi:hypothetical protein
MADQKASADALATPAATDLIPFLFNVAGSWTNRNMLLSGVAAFAPVQSVAGRGGAVTLTVADVSGALPTTGGTMTGDLTLQRTGDPTKVRRFNVAVDGTISIYSIDNSTVDFTLSPGGALMARGTVATYNGGSSALQLATLASPAFTGTPAAPTPATADSSTTLATTAFVKAQGYLSAVPATYALLASPTFTGTPAAPTPATGDNSTQLATTAFVKAQGYLSAVPATYAPLASPALTGTPTAPTAAADTNTTQAATTAFVLGQASSVAPIVDGTAATGASLRYARADHVHPTDISREATANKNQASGYAGLTAGGVILAAADPCFLFGDGSDGTVTISSGTTTLTRDMYYQNLTISGTSQLVTGGFRVFVRGTLDLSAAPAGAIQRNGVAGGAGATAGTIGSIGNTVTAASLGGAAAGGAAGAGGTAAGSGSTAPSTQVSNGGLSGASGAGGTGSGGAGGAGQAAAAQTAMSIRRHAFELQSGVTLLSGGMAGAGGGGGGGDGTAGAGGGGASSGGGVVWIAAATINRGGSTATGAIQANAGAAGAGGAATAGNRGGGGGAAGAGGGWIFLIYAALTGSTATGAVAANGSAGGAGGAGFGTGTAGGGGGGGSGGRITVFDLAGNTITETLGSAGGSAVGVTGGSAGTLSANL